MIDIENIKRKNILHFLGSIKLAIPLLVVIVLILIGATFYESQVGSTVVQQEIYKSPWFGFLMFLLALNLGVSALNRYPWRGARKVGFALTHLGLIVIIAGSAAVIHLGKEGLILLRTDAGINNQVRVEGELLEVINSDGKLDRTELFIKPDGTFQEKKFAGLSLLDYEENTIQTYDFIEQENVHNPAVKLSLTSQRMGQTIERWLALSPLGYEKIDLGPATLKIDKVQNKQEFQQLLNSLSEDNKYPFGKINISFNQDLIKSINVQKNLNNELKVSDDFQVKVIGFWRDFRLDKNRQPVSASEELRNPAIALDIKSDKGQEKWFLFANNKFPPVRSLISGEALEKLNINYELNTNISNNYFEVIVDENENLYYITKSSQGVNSGKLFLNEAINPGWLDFQITATKYINNAQIKREIVPIDNNNNQGIPALLVATESGKKTWLPWGEPTIIKDNNGQEIYASFGAKLMQLPFNIALEDFIVERNEGSESVAMWTSKIRIEDPVDNSIFHRQVWMNHPTWYHGWKIAQASWNPGDLRQSTLQVKREPAWVTALTWTGSALVIMGVAWIFYGPAITKSKVKNKSSLEAPELELSNNK